MIIPQTPHVPPRVRPLVGWEHRLYPGDLAHARAVRTDLATDLCGFGPDLVDTVQLCVSELFANCVKYTDSGRPGADVLRALCLPAPHTLRVGLSDWGGSGTLPTVPTDRTDDEWDWAEGQRGLALVENLSTGWGSRRQAPWADLGTHVWAEFALDPADVPLLPPYVFTRP